MEVSSKRKYLFAFIERDAVESGYISLDGILNHKNDYEYIYAIQEELDNILDLKVGERFVMNFNRDNADSLGSIKRIQ